MSEDYSLVKEVSNETIRSWSERSYISKDLREKIVNADALIVPNEGYASDKEICYFPEGTEHLISFLRKNNTEDQYIDICIEDDDYKELAQHADWIVLAKVIATLFIAPLIVNLLAEYIKRKFGSRIDKATVKSTLMITDESNGKSITLTYEGEALAYKDVMLNTIKEIQKESRALPAKSKLLSKTSKNKDEAN